MQDQITTLSDVEIDIVSGGVWSVIDGIQKNQMASLEEQKLKLQAVEARVAASDAARKGSAFMTPELSMKLSMMNVSYAASLIMPSSIISVLQTGQSGLKRA